MGKKKSRWKETIKVWLDVFDREDVFVEEVAAKYVTQIINEKEMKQRFIDLLKCIHGHTPPGSFKKEVDKIVRLIDKGIFD